ncbi:MAG: hypothetical protein ACLFVT_08720 [Syntrophobacteria bacterium]
MEKRAVVIAALAVVVIMATAGILVWKWDALVEKIAEKHVIAERQAWMERTRELERVISRMERQKEPQSFLPRERLVLIFGDESPLVKGVSPKCMECQQLEESLRAFCLYLDSAKTFNLPEAYEDTWAFFTDLVATLSRHLPTISGEYYRAEIILENSFYFFRLLGKKKIEPVRDILKYESDLSEPLMGIFYRWLISGSQCDKPPPSLPALKKMYRYAGFFLNTLGGHSYLCRRDSRIRLLTLYYSILVLHEANLQGVNELGLDVRFFLPLVFNEIKNRDDLLYADEYLQTLSNLQLHYFRRP